MGFPEDRCWQKLITTAEYADGVVCLAQSLWLVGSCYPLVCWVTDDPLGRLVEQLSSRDGVRCVPLTARVLPSSPASSLTEPGACQAREQNSNAAPLFRDATRRVLWRHGRSFVLLDADMIGVRLPF